MLIKCNYLTKPKLKRFPFSVHRFPKSKNISPMLAYLDAAQLCSLPLALRL